MAKGRSNAGFVALVATQAISALSQNFLRSALLTLVAFGSVDTGGLNKETTIALATLCLVAPYAFLSMPAGRIADRFPKTHILRTVKVCEVFIFCLAAIGLLALSVPILLFAVLLLGVAAALFGPAKFGILPELLPRERLIRGNAWVSATGTLAILAGLIAGNLVAGSSHGVALAAFSGVALALLGWAVSCLIPMTFASSREIALSPPAFLSDFARCFSQLMRMRVLILPMIGCSWFWFQGVANTSLLPLYIAQNPSLPESIVSLLLVVSTLGIALGAIAARWLEGRFAKRQLPLAAFLLIALPGLNIWLNGPLNESWDIVRACLDFFVLAAGCGFYSVPLVAAVQQLTPDHQRARFIGLNHTLNGFAMMAAGLTVVLSSTPWVSIELLFALIALTSGGVGALALHFTLPTLLTTRIHAVP